MLVGVARVVDDQLQARARRPAAGERAVDALERQVERGAIGLAEEKQVRPRDAAEVLQHSRHGLRVAGGVAQAHAPGAAVVGADDQGEAPHYGRRRGLRQGRPGEPEADERDEARLLRLSWLHLSQDDAVLFEAARQVQRPRPRLLRAARQPARGLHGLLGRKRLVRGDEEEPLEVRERRPARRRAAAAPRPGPRAGSARPDPDSAA